MHRKDVLKILPRAILASLVAASCSSKDRKPTPPPTTTPSAKSDKYPLPRPLLTPTPFSSPTAEATAILTPTPEIKDQGPEIAAFLKADPIRVLPPEEVSQIIGERNPQGMIIKPADFDHFYGGRVIVTNITGNISYKVKGNGEEHEYSYPSKFLIAAAPNGRLFTMDAQFLQIKNGKIIWETLTGKSPTERMIRDYRLDPISYFQRVFNNNACPGGCKGIFHSEENIYLPIDYGNNPFKIDMGKIVYGGNGIFLGQLVDKPRPDFTPDLRSLTLIPSQTSHPTLPGLLGQGNSRNSNCLAVLYYLGW